MSVGERREEEREKRKKRNKERKKRETERKEKEKQTSLTPEESNKSAVLRPLNPAPTTTTRLGCDIIKKKKKKKE